MSNIESMLMPRATEKHRRSANAVAARLSPFIEKALLFSGFAAAAGCWMAVIWWIVR